MLAAILATYLLAAPDSTAVIAVGDDAAVAARLQAALEGAVKSPLGAGAVGARIGIPEPEPTPHPDRARARELLAKASAAFYDDRYEELLDALRKAEEIELEPRERIEVSLWRASVVLALGDRAGAARAVHSALTLDPDLVVDVKVFPPAIRDIATEEKAKLGPIPVTVPKIPDGATLTVDGRPAGAKLSLPPGTHVAELSGPGIRRARRTFEVTVGKPTTIDVAFAPSLASDVASEIASAVSRADAPSNRFEIVKKLDAAVVVFAVARADESRAVVWWREDGRRSASEWRANDERGRSALAAFVAKELAAGAPSQRDRAWRWSTTVITGAAIRNLSVTQRTDRELAYRGGFGGLDLKAEATAARGPWSLMVGAGTRSYSMTKVRATQGTQTLAAGTGGDSWSASAEAAWTPPLGAPGESQRFDAMLGLGIEYERYAGFDPGAYGFLPDHTWYAATGRAGVSAKFPLGSGHLRVVLRGAAGLGHWEDHPSGTLGEPEAVSLALGGDTSVTWIGAGTWRAGAGASLEARVMKFSGYARTAVQPPLQDANVAETLQGFHVFVGKEF